MATIALRVKTKSGQQVVKCLTKESTIKDLKEVLSDVSDIPISKLHVLSGFPPKTLDISQDNLDLNSSGLSSGDTLILEERSIESVPIVTNTVPNSINETINQIDNNCAGILMKHVVPADNSCLFTSVNFVLNGKLDESGEAAPYLRKLIAETIKNESFRFDEAMLGKPLDEYCAWIQDDKSWGGAIELSILCNYYGVEIAVVDTVNAIINRFGEDQSYPLRVFLMFDGIHYDPLYMEPLYAGPITTLFETTNEEVFNQAEQLAHEAKSSRQFTDVNKFTLKCLVCNVMLKGQTQAQQHAQSTGHANFGEV